MRKCFGKILLLGMIFALSGCSESNNGDGNVGTAGQENTANEAETPIELKTYSWDDAKVYEAESGNFVGGTKTGTSGDITYVEGFAKAEEDALEITIHIDETGFYDLWGRLEYGMLFTRTTASYAIKQF